MCHKSLPLSTCLVVGFPYGNVLLKNKRFSADGQTIAQNKRLERLKFFTCTSTSSDFLLAIVAVRVQVLNLTSLFSPDGQNIA